MRDRHGKRAKVRGWKISTCSPDRKIGGAFSALDRRRQRVRPLTNACSQILPIVPWFPNPLCNALLLFHTGDSFKTSLSCFQSLDNILSRHPLGTVTLSNNETRPMASAQVAAAMTPGEERPLHSFFTNSTRESF